MDAQRISKWRIRPWNMTNHPTRQLCGRIILFFYKNTKVISWDTVTTDISVRQKWNNEWRITYELAIGRSEMHAMSHASHNQKGIQDGQPLSKMWRVLWVTHRAIMKKIEVDRYCTWHNALKLVWITHILFCKVRVYTPTNTDVSPHLKNTLLGWEKGAIAI